MGLAMSTALCHVLGSHLDRVLPYRDALAEGKHGQIHLYSPNLWQGSPQKERGAAGDRALASLAAPQAISGLLLMFTRQVWRRLSKDQKLPQLSLGSCFLLAGAGPQDGRREEKPSSPLPP